MELGSGGGPWPTGGVASSRGKWVWLSGGWFLSGRKEGGASSGRKWVCINHTHKGSRDIAHFVCYTCCIVVHL